MSNILNQFSFLQSMLAKPKTVVSNTLAAGQIGTALVNNFIPRQEQLYIVHPNGTRYFFDAVMREDHTLQRMITQHPVQDGAAITDHSYQMPAQLIVEVAMSEAMKSIVPLQFGDLPYPVGNGFLSQRTGGASAMAVAQGLSFLDRKQSFGKRPRSDKAFEVLSEMQAAGMPLSVQTRLKLYKNMLIENIKINDDKETVYSLFATISFKEVFVCKTVTVAASTLTQVVGGLTPEVMTLNETSNMVSKMGTWPEVYPSPSTTLSPMGFP